jgi:hypothetical protein
MWRRDRHLFVLLLAPFLLTFIAAAMRKYPYGGSARVAQYVAPAVCLLAGLGVSGTIRCLLCILDKLGATSVVRFFLRGPNLRLALAGCAIALSIIPIGTMVLHTLRPYKSLAVRKGQDAVRAVAGQTAPGDRWIIFNANRPVPYAPFLGDWRGVGGQFVFDALRFCPASVRPVIWSPPPESVEPKPGGRTWLLAYYAQRDKVEFDDAQLAAYVATFSVRLGQATEETLPIEEKPSKYEALKVYRFDPPRR